MQFFFMLFLLSYYMTNKDVYKVWW